MSMRIARLLAVLFPIVLAACGGGGDHRSGPPPTISLSVDKVAIQDIIGAMEADEEDLYATLGGGTGVYYYRLVLDHPERFDIADATSATSTMAKIQLVARHDLPGRSSGTGSFDLCMDAGCSNLAVSQKFTYTIVTFQVDSPIVSLSAWQDGVSAPQDVLITPEDTDGVLGIWQKPHSPPVSWLTTTRIGSTFSMQASAVGLDPGTYFGDVILGAGAKLNIDTEIMVALDVRSATVPPTPPRFAMTVSSTPTTLSRIVPVAFADGMSPAWTADVDQPWLTLQGASGTGAGSLVLAVDPLAAASAVPDWTSATGHLTIHPAGLPDLVVPVTLDMQLPSITGVSPSVTGLTGYTTLTVTGRGLSQPGALGRITIDGGKVVSRVAGSDKSATVRIAALAAGRHATTVTNVADVPAPGSALFAVDADPQPYAFVAESGSQSTSMLDTARNAVFSTRYGGNYLTRIMKVNGTWRVTHLAMARVANVGMSFDHGTLYVTSGDDTVSLVDPDTMTVRETLTAPFDVSATSSRHPSLPSTSDGRVWLDSWGGYRDPSTKTFGNYYGAGAQYPSVAAPDDGSVLFLADGVGHEGRRYTSATQSVAAEPDMPYMQMLRMSANANRRIANGSALYDDQWTLLGDLTEVNSVSPGYPGYTGDGGILSPDGSRAYALVNTSDNGYDIVFHIGVFDTTQHRPGSTAMLEVGRIALPDQAACGHIPGATWCDYLGNLMIDASGSTLYWRGDHGLVVLPIPASLRQAGAVPATRSMRKATAR